MLSVAILGPGGVGGFVAAMLVKAGHDVVVVGREEEVEVIALDGISIDSLVFGQFNARPRAASTLTAPTDVLLVTTKATTLSDALERVQACPRLVVPLLNGLEHVTTLRGHFDGTYVAAGTIRMEADLPAPGRVVHTSPSVRVELATDDVRAESEVAELAEILTRAGIPTVIGTSEAQVLWSKLVRLNALASTTSAANAAIGVVREDPRWRAALVACIEETAATANADGASIDPAASLAELDAAHPGLGSSMQRDIAAGREPELDAILGAVQRAAERHGIECPTIASLAVVIAERAGITSPRS